MRDLNLQHERYLTFSLNLLAVLFFTISFVQGEETVQFAPPPFQLPEGFEIELVAGPPLVKHPMLGSFDREGRLYVCESAGENMNAEQLLDKLPNFVHILEDTDGDGHFDTSTRFADKMTFPQGGIIHHGSFYCASPPYIWKFTDSDGDSIAEVRVPWLGKFNFYGHAGALHGPFLGPTGRFFWCAAPLGHEIRDQQGNLIRQGTASRIFFCREDGTEVDAYCGGGMYNPVEVAFTADGDMLGIMTYYNPGKARRDALVHYVYGGVYPKNVPAWLAEFKRTGPWMPPLIRYGVVAPSGIMRYRSRHLGQDVQDNFFISHFNTRTVERVHLTREGATYHADAMPFLTSTSAEFHPSDVIEDADGSLLVIDTGGWFAGAGCPTSKISKPRYYGAIYRIRRTNAATPADPCGTAINWSFVTENQLVDVLNDDRAVVRDRAVELLAQRLSQNVISASAAFQIADSCVVRRRLIWALARSTSNDAKVAIRSALGDVDAGVRLAALHSITMSRDAAAGTEVIRRLSDSDLRVRRQAAAVLGRLGDAKAVGPLLDALSQRIDRTLEHALIHALIEIDDRDKTLVGLTHPSPHVRRRTLIALDQMDHGQLSRDLVVPLLETDDRQLQQVALEIIGRHTGWAEGTLPLLQEWVYQSDLPSDHQQALREALSAMTHAPVIQQFIAEHLTGKQTPIDNRRLLLGVIANHELPESPAIWTEPIAAMLLSRNEQLARQAIGSAERCGTSVFVNELNAVLVDRTRSSETKLVAAAAMARSGDQIDSTVFDLLLDDCHADRETLMRMTAADALSAAQLTDEQFRVLIKTMVSSADPIVLRPILRAFEKNRSAPVGLELIASLSQASSLLSLTTQQLTAAIQHCPQEVQSAAEPLVERIRANSQLTSERLNALETEIIGGDSERGRTVFFGKKASCHACHQVHGEGGGLGPDLSGIGQIRTSRDLLEALLAPNATFARGYEPIVITLSNGKAESGVISRRTEDAIYLGRADRKEIRIARSDMEEVLPSSVSVMPQGLEKQLSMQELSDLIVFLQSLKQ